MYVTMNRFKIKPEFADAYIQVWKDAGVRTKDVDGFLEFKFFRLDSKEEGYVLFSSYAVWKTRKNSSPGRSPNISASRTRRRGEPRDVC